MPKIPQYSRQKFQSSYVGGPQVDKSGGLIAEGVEKAVAPIIEQQTQKEEAKIQASIEQQADNAAVQYSLKYQNTVNSLQDKYANDPTKVSLRAVEEGEKLAQAMGKGIPDDRVRTRFLAGANAMAKQSALTLTKWGVEKQKENGAIAAFDKVNTMAFTLGQTDDLATFTNNLNATIEEMGKLPNVQQEHIREAIPGFYDTHMYLKATTDPDGFEKELDDYKDLPFLPKDFRVNALKAIESQRKKEKAELVTAQRENRYILGNEIINEEIPLVQMFGRIDEVKASMGGKGLTTSDLGWLKKTLFTKVNSGVLDIQDESFVQDKYLTKINEIAINATDKRKRQAVILEMAVDGFSKQEIQDLNTLYGFSNSSKFNQTVSFLKDALNQVTSKTEDKDAQYSFMKEWTSRVVNGEEPKKVTEEISAAALTHQAHTDNPDIANFPASGQLMVSDDGSVARVYPDGRREDR